MRRVLFLVMFVLLLVGCGGNADTTVEPPPGAANFERSDSPQVNQIVEQLRTAVPAEMQNQQVLPETLEEHVYQSTASLDDIAAHYNQLVEKGWYHVPTLPGMQNGVLVSGYENGTTTLVVGAIDASQLGGSGVVIYTAKGTK